MMVLVLEQNHKNERTELVRSLLRTCLLIC
jgi:hypothetical protein